MTSDLISIIIPIYKVEPYLRKCVESAIAQTYRNLEIILVDDGSPDNCGKICDEYALIDSRVKVIHKENGGLSDARNVGIDIAQGEYLALLDGDDFIAADMISILYDRLCKDQSDLAICNYVRVDEKYEPVRIKGSNPIKNEVISPSEALKRLCCHEKYWYYVTVVHKLWKSKIFNEIRFPLGKLHEDEFVTHKLIAQCKRVSCVSSALYYYVKRKDSITGSEFSMGSLDRAEGLFTRGEYMASIQSNFEATYPLLEGIKVLILAYIKLSLKDREVRRRLKELIREYEKLCSVVITAGVGFRKTFLLTVFGIGLKVFMVPVNALYRET